MTYNEMPKDSLPSRIIAITSQVEALPASTTLEEFRAACGIADWPGGWDASDGYPDFNTYTWHLEDGFNLHGCFINGDSVTNRFGPAGISKNGVLIWQWSPNQDDLATMRGHSISIAADASGRG